MHCPAKNVMNRRAVRNGLPCQEPPRSGPREVLPRTMSRAVPGTSPGRTRCQCEARGRWYSKTSPQIASIRKPKPMTTNQTSQYAMAMAASMPAAAMANGQ